ncbi:MAG: zinc protease [Lentisphaeria bacterium]|jgi:zinc protease
MTISSIRLNIFILLTLLIFSANSLAAKAKEVRTIEGISEYSLNNGLQILLFPDDSKDTTTVNVTYRVGSKHENYGETGMAHLLEHLLFKGTPKHPNITKELTDHGADANGTTWLERTNYYETFKATEDNLKWALELESDRMVNSFIAQKDLDSEMTVVLNEFEMGENSPANILLQRVYATAFDWHNYSNSTIGAKSDIENVKIKNLKGFYQKYYQPDNATLIVAGKFNKQKTLKIIGKTFGKIKQPSRTLPHLYTEDPVQDGERSVTLRRVGSEQGVSAAYHIPSGAHQDFAAIGVLSVILGDTPSGRMHKSLVDEKLATLTWAWSNQQKDASLLYFNVSADTDTDLEKSATVLLNTVENIAERPITESELERAKRKILTQIELAFNSSQDISIQLSEWIGIGDWRMLFIHRDRIAAVTLDDVKRVAEHYLVSSNRTLGKFIPTDKPVRAEIAESAPVNEIVEGYTGHKKIAQGEIFEANLENISAREIRTSHKGINIASLPIKTRGESVFIDMRLGIGNQTTLANKTSVAELTSAMLLRGISRLDRDELQDEFDRLKAQGNIGGAVQSVVAAYETTHENLPKVIALIHEVLTTPTFSKKEFELLKAQRLAQLEANITNPQALAFSTYAAQFNTYPKGHVHYAKSIQEDIDAVKNVQLSDVLAFYNNQYGADNMQVGIAGDFDEAAIKQKIIALFDGWKNRLPFKRIPRIYAKAKKTKISIETPDKKNSVFVAGINFEMTRTNEEAAALEVVAHILGGGFINSRLATRIRQKEGLSYGVGAVVRLLNIDTNGRFIAYAISAPENTNKVEQAFIEEMQRAIEDGFTEEELSSAKDSILDSAKVAYSNNQNLARILRDIYRDGRSIDDEKLIEESVRALTLDDINRVMRKYLDPANMTVVSAGDFAALSP